MARAKRQAKRKVETEPLVNTFAADQGNYGKDTGEGKSTLTRNKWVTTVERWKTAQLLSLTQARAIEYCEDLWEKAGTSSSLVADFLRIPGGSGGNGWAQQEALDELARIKAMVPTEYFGVFELVCRFDEPGGTAGSRWANDDRKASLAALMCVRFVADLIAMWRRL